MSKLNDLPLRVVTALFMLGIVSVAIWQGLFAIGVLTVLAAGLLGFEAARMAAAERGVAAVCGFAMAVAVGGIAANAIFVFGAGVLGLAIFTIRFIPDHKWAAAALFCYGIVGLSAMFLLTAHFSSYVLIAMLIVAIATDVGAYSLGRMIGGPKLVPRISPSKTWAGLFGGLLFGSAAAYALFNKWGLGRIGEMQIPVISDYARNFYHQDGVFLPLWAEVLIVIGIILGDLTISYLKRVCGVKDSGKLFPGHGGLWDRFDGFGMGAFVVWCLAVAGAVQT